ncbi:unnamed protein product [Diabrotica balteata]|uniref:Uncharacterized protein n=1 Tax=Diabrotica balteata TaxID=107213 RepID=A0A9N9XIL1_DIABA|nr:unnamed protein product [Diabrotica balteata]
MVSHCLNYQLQYRKKSSENLLIKTHQQIAEGLQIKLNNAKVMYLTTDSWTSRSNESYIAVTAHYIDEQSKLCSFTIGYIQYNERHTAENMLDFLKNKIQEWQISHKIDAVLSDNVPNILLTVKMDNWTSVRCFSHSLNLVVQK